MEVLKACLSLHESGFISVCVCEGCLGERILFQSFYHIEGVELNARVTEGPRAYLHIGTETPPW